MRTSLNRIPFLIFLCLITFYLSGCEQKSSEQIVSIKNSKMELGFDKNAGALLLFRDLVNSHEFLETTSSHGSLWEIDLLHGSEIETIDMTTSSKFHISKRKNSLILTWKGFSGTENKYCVSENYRYKRYG